RTCRDYAFDRDDLAHLLKDDVRLAAGDELGRVAAFLELCFASHLIRDAETLEQLVDVDAAGAAACRIDIGDRFGVKQSALERVDRGDIRPGSALLYADTDAHGRDVGPA